jgi:hypothetical protein
MLSTFTDELAQAKTRKKNSWKYFKPAQLLPRIPFIGEKSLNAMTTPYIGT